MNQNEQNTPSGKMYVAVPVSEALPEKEDVYFVLTDCAGNSGIDCTSFRNGEFRFPEDSWDAATHWLREVEAPLPAPVPSRELIDQMRAAIEAAWEDYASDQTFMEQAAKACAQIALNISPENVQP